MHSQNISSCLSAMASDCSIIGGVALFKLGVCKIILLLLRRGEAGKTSFRKEQRSKLINDNEVVTLIAPVQLMNCCWRPLSCTAYIVYNFENSKFNFENSKLVYYISRAPQ